ncbi:MAG: XrtA/PEP-CTERM system histidine kinase PrsK, partial [Pseudomonadota bacterium]
RDAIKFLSLGIASLFVYDLILFSGSAVVGEVNAGLWSSRGFVIAMSAPLLAIAASRSEAWSMKVFVSRQVVFHSATLVGAGTYLTLVGLAGSFLQRNLEDWGQTAQVALFSAGLIGLALFFLSGSSLSSIRVFISKHFFANRYDYREEWLRLIDTLTDTDDQLPLRKRSVRAILDILQGESGRLWLRNKDDDAFHNVSSWDAAETRDVIPGESAVIAFVERTGWVVDFDELRQAPDRYEGLELNGERDVFSGERFLVPLVNADVLIGFVSVAVEIRHPNLNFEDTDLLKTAGQQIAAYLAQEQAVERLAETRQFEAYNRMAAYLMHDLKNVSAQLSLVVKNAEKHRRNPEFVDDAIDTVRGSDSRLKSVIDHLHQGKVVPRLDTVELSKLVLQSVSQCADRRPEPKAVIPDSRVYVNADAERLQMALFHAVRNAQDASDEDDSVTVELAEQDGRVTLTVADTGEGMSADYVEKHFFKPFSSTKGAKGMGIGAYQIQETVRSLGGEVTVESVPSAGTKLVMALKARGNGVDGVADAEKV